MVIVVLSPSSLMPSLVPPLLTIFLSSSSLHLLSGRRFSPAAVRADAVILLVFSSPLIVSYFFAFLGPVVFSRGSKKVLFWRTVQEQ